MGQVIFHFRVDLLPCLLKQWLIEVAIAHLPGQIADARKEPAGHRDQPVEEPLKGFGGGRRQDFDRLQTPLEHAQDRRYLPLQALMRFVDPEQTFFQLGRTLQCPQAVMGQRTPEGVDKGRGKLFATRLEHTQVGKEVGLGSRRFTADRTVYLRLALEQRAYVHKDVKNLILTLSYFVALGGRGAIL